MAIGDQRDLVHTGPGTLAGRFMRRFWQPVLRATDLPPGRATAIRIMSEDLTLYRGEDSVPHVLARACAHRGAQLSAGLVEDDCLRCFYHGWKYDGSGQCVEQPAEDTSFAAKVRIHTYPTQEYLGLIFVYLGEGEAPPMRRHPELEEAGVLEVLASPWPCNFFQSVENSTDQTHFSFVHRDSSFAASGLGAIPSVSYEESEYGMTCHATRPGGVTRVTHFFIPTSNQFKQPLDAPDSGWADVLTFKVPVDDEHHVLYLVNRMPLSDDAARQFETRRQARQEAAAAVAELAEAVLAGNRRWEDLDVPAAVMVMVQDYVAVVPQRLPDRAHERLGRGDVGVILLRSLWTRELEALAENRPLKEWRRPERVSALTGV
jgi:5,5'-dehydrodivanillate O-demethylase oxygenase subunit